MKDGKLFGKLNIIDLLVILLVIAAAAFLALRLGNRTPSTPSTSTGRIRYVVKVTRMDPEIYEVAKARYDAGETQLVAGDSLIDGQIVDMRAEPYVTTLTTDEGKYVVAEDPYYLNVYYTIEAGVTTWDINLVVSQEIRLGASNWVRTRGAQFQGTVIDFEKFN